MFLGQMSGSPEASDIGTMWLLSTLSPGMKEHVSSLQAVTLPLLFLPGWLSPLLQA